jgi:hypothetical protein
MTKIILALTYLKNSVIPELHSRNSSESFCDCFEIIEDVLTCDRFVTRRFVSGNIT